jgi:hypothetical protein
MKSEPEGSSGRRASSPHILSASVVMIGVATTLVGLVKVAKAHMAPTHVDQYAGLTALLFLLSAGASYLSIRYADPPSVSPKWEWIADLLFCCGLFAISVIAVFFAFEVI